MLVGGVTGLTTLDYPGSLSAVIFFRGCPWRCSYCHNKHLQVASSSESLLWEDVLHLLKTRVGFVEAVVFSGGEPLQQAHLPAAIEDVKRLGFRIGLHTSGAFPERLALVLPLVDWVGFDVKHEFDNYYDVTGVPESGFLAQRSLNMLISSGVRYEVRMTVCESLDSLSIVNVFKGIAAQGVKTVALQKCRDKDENIVEHPIFSDRLLLEDISKRFENFSVR
ncbi:MAG: anaerobic ribonucleoside-triphosphate reductase activating protein [Holosporaceae bacterium]|nr:anaerobic ribonucleoside-triphosphate reductase activating protein [Holosporaceae bacterium]